jgi:hypothetical protein
VLRQDLRFASPQRQEYAYELLRTLSSIRKGDETVAQGLEKMRTFGESLLLSSYGEIRDVELHRFLWDGCREENWIRRIHATDRVSADSFILAASRASTYRTKFSKSSGKGVFHAQELEGRAYAQGNPVYHSMGKRKLCRIFNSDSHYWAKCPNTFRDQAYKEKYRQLRDKLKTVNIAIPEQDEDTSENELDKIIEEAVVVHVKLYTLAETTDLHACGVMEISDIHNLANSLNAATPLHAIVDTDAATSVVSRFAFRSLCRQMGKPDLTPSKLQLRLGNGLHTSSGSFQMGIRMPHEILSAAVEVQHSVEAPLLLGNYALVKWNAIIRAGAPVELEVRGDKIQLQKQGSHWVIPNERLALNHSFVNFNKEELCKLHRRLVHPHPDRLLDLLKKAAPEELQKDTRKVLNTLYESCIACSKTKPKPLVFKAAVPDEIIFGHEVVLEMCNIGGKVVLHIVDRGTAFQAAEFVVSQRAGDLWEQFLRIWATKYMSPDILTSDAGSAFLSQLWN